MMLIPLSASYQVEVGLSEIRGKVVHQMWVVESSNPESKQPQIFEIYLYVCRCATVYVFLLDWVQLRAVFCIHGCFFLIKSQISKCDI